MPTRSYVQVATDGSGKKVANVANTDPTAADASGNATADTTTYQQLVTQVDKRGDWVTASDVTSSLDAIHETLQLILAALED